MFEGLKAYRREDGKVQLFRPEQNALRMKLGAERMCLTSPSVDQFVEAVKQTVLANKHWVFSQFHIFHLYKNFIIKLSCIVTFRWN